MNMHLFCLENILLGYCKVAGDITAIKCPFFKNILIYILIFYMIHIF